MKQSDATILVVDDLEQLRGVVKDILESEGYQVLAARSGAEALLIAASHVGPIHLLLTDLQMPGMSGRELVRLLNALRPEIGVLYMTGDPGGVFNWHEVENSSASFLTKPFDRPTLLSKVRHSVHGTGKS